MQSKIARKIYGFVGKYFRLQTGGILSQYGSPFGNSFQLVLGMPQRCIAPAVNHGWTPPGFPQPRLLPAAMELVRPLLPVQLQSQL